MGLGLLEYEVAGLGAPRADPAVLYVWYAPAVVGDGGLSSWIDRDLKADSVAPWYAILDVAGGE